MRFTKWKISRNDGNTPYPESPKVRTLRYKTELTFIVIVRIKVAYIISSPLSHPICILHTIRYPVPTAVAFQSVTSKMHLTSKPIATST